MSQFRLSVILPVHNGMPFIERSISSILEQSYEDFEFLIGDDGSNDGTSELVEQLAATDHRIRHLRREQKSGLAASADWLVREARAPLVAIAHADDFSHRERLRRQVLAFDERPDLQLVGSLWESIDAGGRLLRRAEPWRLVRQSVFAPFPHSSVMFRKQAYLAAGGYRPETEYWEDLDLYLRIGELGRMGVLAEPLVTVRHSRASTRLRDRQEEVEDAVHTMYRAVEMYRRGQDYGPLITDARPRHSGGKLDPRTFVACGLTHMWDGRPPGLMKRMWRRADLGFNLRSFASAAWVIWASVNPSTLRAFTLGLGRYRNRSARSSAGLCRFFEWRPGDHRSGEAPRVEGQSR